MGAVGVPVWLWTQGWQPQTATAAAGGISATVTATITKVVWSMGDGNTVTCAGPGTAYNLSMGWKQSPDCGYLYSRQSADKPGQAFQVAATFYWNVVWTGAYTGNLRVTTTSTVPMTVGEYQSLVRVSGSRN